MTLAPGEPQCAGEGYLSDLESIEKIRVFVWLVPSGDASRFSPPADLARDEEERILRAWKEASRGSTLRELEGIIVRRDAR